MLSQNTDSDFPRGHLEQGERCWTCDSLVKSLHLQPSACLDVFVSRDHLSTKRDSDHCSDQGGVV